MRSIQLLQPAKVIIGENVVDQLTEDELILRGSKILFVVAEPLVERIKPISDNLKSESRDIQTIIYNFPGEPTFALFKKLQDSLIFTPDCVVGIGGGSVLDCAKLLAALADKKQALEDVVGMQLINERATKLICIPTTSGTGSEMSPNAILLNEKTNAKSGIISKYLVPDVSYIDPVLTIKLPPRLTAETGIDALSHCIEAYTNKFAHPAVDMYALEGIRLIAANLVDAVKDGDNLHARTALSLGSMYGGICLGPVNTSAVHALSYGLGGKYHISHGLANAILLAEVLAFNAPASPERHLQVALAMGIKNDGSVEEIIQKGIQKIRDMALACGLPERLSDLGIQKVDIPELADIAMQVTRLLNNNPRVVTKEDAIRIYEKLY
jgi:alcohol dehydrogenase class IV